MLRHRFVRKETCMMAQVFDPRRVCVDTNIGDKHLFAPCRCLSSPHTDKAWRMLVDNLFAVQVCLVGGQPERDALVECSNIMKGSARAVHGTYLPGWRTAMSALVPWVGVAMYVDPCLVGGQPQLYCCFHVFGWPYMQTHGETSWGHHGTVPPTYS